jgi:hypothetical protein
MPGQTLAPALFNKGRWSHGSNQVLALNLVTPNFKELISNNDKTKNGKEANQAY